MQFVDIKIMDTNLVSSDPEFMTNISSVFNDAKAAMTVSELGNLHRLTKKVMRLEGDIAEVGVYQGGSAKIMATACEQKKNIHLFDTFEGIPEVTENLDRVVKGDFASSLDAVKSYLSPFKNIRFYPGMFPDSVAKYPEILEKKFSLVNLDVDTYVSTVKCLEFFYSRVVPGGIIITHDYGSTTCPGVKKAVDEFFANKQETVIEMWATQALICKA